MTRTRQRRGALAGAIALLTAMLAAAAMLAPAPAAAKPPVVGIGEQQPWFFDDPYWQDLGVRDVRYVVPWDALAVPADRELVDRWMAAAERANARVLVTFGHSRVNGKEKLLPSRRRFLQLFRAFRERFPFVRTYQAWNEGNHASQPVHRRPERAAEFYNVIRAVCRGCTVSAPSVLDGPNMVRWIKRFRAKARGRVRLWSVHNYIDANRFQNRGTKRLLRLVRGNLWFTETGGIVERGEARRKLPYNERHAARATRQVFRLARLSRRVKRVYFYHWTATPKGSRWDSALMDRRGKPRPAYAIVRRQAALRRTVRPTPRPVPPAPPGVPASPGVPAPPGP